jgi:Mrp family chromosome partitioning ATPase/capsular polysaccharide biosynthesis protein
MGRTGESDEALASGLSGALAPYARAVRAHWVLAVCVFGAVVLGALLWLAFRPASYDARAQLLVTPLPQDDTTFLGLPLLRDSGDPTRTVQTAAALVDNDQVAARTAARMGRGWSTARVKGAVAVLPEGQSNVIDVSATASPASRAVKLANTYTQTALEVRRDRLRAAVAASIAVLAAQVAPGGTAAGDANLIARLNDLRRIQDGQDPTISLSEQATDAQGTSTSGALVLLLALAAGAILATGAALAMEGLSPRRVANETELLDTFPLPLLARVPVAGRRSHGAGPPELREAFRTLRVQLELDDERGGAILITSASRREGKTQSAIDLALELASVGRRVVLVDLDLRAPRVAAMLGVTPGRDLLDVARRGDPLADALQAVPDTPSLRIAAPISASDPRRIQELEARLPALMQEARDVADYVLVDAPPLGEISDALAVVPFVDHVLVVARPGTTARTALLTLRDLLARAGRSATGYVVVGGLPRRWTHAPYAGMALRRGREDGAAADAGEPLVVGTLRLDPGSGRAWRGDDELALRPAPRTLLETLMRHPGEVMSRGALFAVAAGENGLRRVEDVDRAVRELRVVIDKPFGLQSIETVRGEGYRLRADGGGIPAPAIPAVPTRSGEI